MQTPQINYHEAVKRLCRFVDDYNENCPTITQTRWAVLPHTGERIAQSVVRKQGTIKASVKATALHLLARYTEAWAAANRGLHNMASTDDVFLATNRVEIGERLNRSHRSVYDHLRKLRAVGIVDKYEFCGRQHSFRLWISPKILFGEAEETKPGTALNALKTAVSDSVRQNLPPSDIPLKKHSTTISNADSGKTRKQGHGNNKDPHNSTLEGNAPTKPALSGTETRKGGRAAGPPTDAYSSWETLFMRLSKYQRNLVFSFWLLIREQLYRRNPWSDDENRMAVLEIYNGVFGRFAVQQSDKAWEEYYNELVQRVTMAKAWFDRHPHRHPDAPFRRGKKPGYFDPNNVYGFGRTDQWLEANQLQKRENRINYLLNQARIDFERLAAGKPRPSKTTLSEMQLFLYYQSRAQPYGKEATDRFCKQYLDQKARNFAPIRPVRPTIRAQKAADKAAAQVIYVESWMTEFGEGFPSEFLT